ncbi:glycosyltransferase [Paenibacillus glufosinatiresistens]|uniref:glycosyltransferase n=1 Tax=Paenibacillus glufosinatiresistens TaxID=3070657 RepID=UPI00286D8F98|nr:glycosyltransferase [Paenibacillus sp. YX.27]
MEKPEISIIVPVYRVEAYIRKCVDSILAQTYTRYELILVDDGSPDGCPAICDEYAARDARVRVIHKTNGGLSDARNRALDQAKGTYIGFVDSDDWIAPTMFEELHRAAETSGADIAVCCHYEAAGDELKRINDFSGYPAVLSRTEALGELLLDRRIQNLAWDKLYRRELFEDVRYPAGMAFEDIPTTYRLFLKADRVALVDRALYYYVQRKESISGTYTLAKRVDKFNGTSRKYADIRRDYGEAIPKEKWDYFIFRMVDEGVGLYNDLLRESKSRRYAVDTETIKRFLKSNLPAILSAKTVSPRLKTAAFALSANEWLYDRIFGTLHALTGRDRSRVS